MSSFLFYFLTRLKGIKVSNALLPKAPLSSSIRKKSAGLFLSNFETKQSQNFALALLIISVTLNKVKGMTVINSKFKLTEYT